MWTSHIDLAMETDEVLASAHLEIGNWRRICIYFVDFRVAFRLTTHCHMSSSTVAVVVTNCEQLSCSTSTLHLHGPQISLSNWTSRLVLTYQRPANLVVLHDDVLTG